MALTYIPVIRNVTPNFTVSQLLTTNDLLVNNNATVLGTVTVSRTTGVATAYAVLNSGVGAFDTFRIYGNGDVEIGPGNGARDIKLSRGAANRLDLLTADLRIATVGRGLSIAEGANAAMGVATLVAGTVTVNTTKVAANSRIQLTIQSLGTVADPKAIGVTARVAGTSFTIRSADVTDTSVVAWEIVTPG
jgi:hypothetical protein